MLLGVQVARLMEMGFSRVDAQEALRASNNDINMATNFLLQHWSQASDSRARGWRKRSCSEWKTRHGHRDERLKYSQELVLSLPLMQLCDWAVRSRWSSCSCFLPASAEYSQYGEGGWRDVISGLTFSGLLIPLQPPALHIFIRKRKNYHLAPMMMWKQCDRRILKGNRDLKDLYLDIIVDCEELKNFTLVILQLEE